MKCGCEHSKHFEPSEKGHAYLEAEATQTVETAMGKFAVCDDCVDCLRPVTTGVEESTPAESMHSHGLVWTSHTFTCELCLRLAFVSTAALADLERDYPELTVEGRVQNLNYCISCIEGPVEGEHVDEAFGRRNPALIQARADRRIGLGHEPRELRVPDQAARDHALRLGLLQELLKVSRSLLVDIESMREEWKDYYGPFEGTDADDGHHIEWPNLAISAAALRAVLEQAGEA